MPNLEPIEERDIDLKNKFTEKPEEIVSVGKKLPESVVSPEMTVERKEGQAEKDDAYSKILSKVKTVQPADNQTVAGDAQVMSVAETAENKIEKLIQLAMQKGVVHAVQVARHLQDNYALDEFHDRLLAQEFHDALIKKGLIEEI